MPPPGERRESSWMVLAGLLVVWLALMIVFKANELSERGGPIRHAASHTAWGGASQEQEPRPRLLRPVSLEAGQWTPRQALAELALRADLQFNEGQLEQLGTQPITAAADEAPAYQALHALLGNPALGLAAGENRLSLIDQRIEDAADGSRRWQAELALGRERLVLAPAADLPLIAATPEDGERVRLDLWSGARWLGTLAARLDAPVGARVGLVDGADRIELTLTRRETPGLYGWELHRHSEAGFRQE